MHRPRPVLAALAAACVVAGCSGSGSTPVSGKASVSPTSVSSTPVSGKASVSPTSVSSAPRSSSPTTSASTASSPARASTPPSVRRALPLSLTTGDADQVITVVASAPDSTTAVLQAWTRAAGGWTKHGPSITAHLGAGGVGTASEGSTRTPAGSFTLTQAFGHDSDPGTRLPYVRTTPDDWWVSQSSSPLYNTRQRCAARCTFTRGDPNEHLYYETPFYDYAVVIDYNTANAPGGIRPGAGSAFFLHVTVGKPTAGCVSIPQDQLVSILRWLRPAAHPRILIGVG